MSMRALVQRVREAEVAAGGESVGRIGRGLLVYLGVGASESSENARWLAEKIANLRIFEDDDGKLNLSVLDVSGEVLAVPNFTLMADARKGRRPSFAAAAGAESAEPLYEAFIVALTEQGCRVARGAFGEHMEISSVADGPVNIIVEFPTGPSGDEPPPRSAP